jgi:hypothetical protein
MIRKGVAYSLRLIAPGVWTWQFQIDDIITTGRTQTNLMGMAAHRANASIDRELRKPRDLLP